MLEPRPNCEYSDTNLPAESTQANIGNSGSTLCSNCLSNLPANTCRNCGGFSLRPVATNTCA